MNGHDGGAPQGQDSSDHADWLRELQRRGAVDERRRQRWLEQQLHDQSTLLGLLVDLADSATAVVLETTSGHRHGGVVALVGIDVVVLTNGDRTTVVALAAIGAIRSTGPRRLTSGADGEHSADVTMLELLGDRLDERPEVTISWAGGQRANGRLVAVGHDVVTVHATGDEVRSVHVAAESIVDVTID
ncbi:MAG: hypothetical protein GXP35_05970 [Actinobacteria bacterium]|nr:hypothetical protein [Actinomycetota bacterium]